MDQELPAATDLPGLRDKGRQRAILYIVVGVGLTLGYIAMQDVSWQSSAQFHTLMESIATLLALMVGIVGLVRYHSRPTNSFLFIGTGFLGTAFLDGYHAVVTSTWLDQYAPSLPDSLIPWSWVASRFFLAVMLFAGLLATLRENRLGEAGRFDHRFVYTWVSMFALVSFFFFALVPLPTAYFAEDLHLHRPQEFIPALIFLLALIGYLREGQWRSHDLDHWLVLALIVSIVSQSVFMPSSHELFDLDFDLAHFLKKASYVCVLIGLLINMLFLYRQADLSARLKQEIRERKRLEMERERYMETLEKEVQRRTANLERRTHEVETANRDLEGFSYSVSHDLRAPLRAIDGFVAILKEGYASKLDGEGLRLLGVVSDNANKMGELIDDILAFSHAGRLEMEQVEIDMNALVDEAWAGLKEKRSAGQYRFDRGDLPEAFGDPHALRQVWKNLLSNAIKFSRGRQPGVIEVTAEQGGGYVRYSVRDNGVGFNSDYVDKLFVMFQRLHGMDEFEGTGVGLAVVKRFIQKHGGDVEATATLNEGATFSFTLPDKW